MMRTTVSRIGAVLSASALAGVAVLGGVGVAQADSLDLGSIIPGSSAPEPGTTDPEPSLELTIDEADPSGVNGTVTDHDVDDMATLEGCGIAVSTAEVAGQYEDYYLENGDLPEPGSGQDDALQAANALHQNWVAFPTFEEGETVSDWTGRQGPDEAEEDYRAGAWVSCELNEDDTLVAFAYEAVPADPVGDFIGSVVGSVDFLGSLEASDS